MSTTADARPPAEPGRPDRPPLKIDDVALARSRYRPTGPLVAFGGREPPPSIAFNPFMPRRTILHPPSARADPGSDMPGMAMDEQVIEVAASWAGVAYASAFAEGVTFLGYAYLSELAQRPEYRAIVGTIAEEMTRKGFKLVAKGTEDKAEIISVLEDELKRLKVIDVLREANEHDGFFGRAHIYLDTGDTEDRDELKIPLGNGWDAISAAKVSPQRPLQRIVTVEPVWVYPTNYNSNDPLRRDWYRPQFWFVQGKELHVSRLLTFIGREVPDLLKPAYSFGGLALTQMVKPYVDNWLRTRQSVADLIHAFSVFVLATDLQTSLQNGGDELFRRLMLFTNFRDNRGLMVTNKETEELQNVSAPLGTLDALQAQTQEHMAAVSRIPLVKLLGIQPAGLNASSEGEIRTFYDTIAAMQEKFFRENLHRILGFVMLSKFGAVDPDITFEWESLWALDEKGEAEVRKINAETGAIHINAGVIDPAEERERVAREPGTPYQNLDIDDVPEPPQEEDTGEGTGGEGGDVDGGTGPEDGSEETKESSGAADAAPFPFVFDAWSEGDHPRGQPGNAGQFGPGGGGGAAGATKEQVSAVKSYTSSPAYKQINAVLRGGQKPNEATQNLIEQMDGYLTTTGPLREATKTYRGVGGEAAKALISKGLKPGDTFIDPGFASTSAIESIAETDVITGARSDILMEIDLPKGARAADISAISGDDEEGEILLGRGTKFVVTSFDQKSGRLKVKALATASEGERPKANASTLYTPPTKTADEIVASFPGAQEAIQKTRARIAAGVSTDAPVSKGGFKQEDGTYTPERQAVHMAIAKQIFSPEAIARATPAEGEKPVLTVLGGRGGSGKSWLTSKDGPVDASKSILLDSDGIKALLPGYDGAMAALYHEEATDILNLLDRRATALGLNTIHDATMKSEGTTALRLAAYEAAGFEVEGYYMHLPAEEAATRALKRYSKGGTFTGRFVPPEVILGNVNNEKNFDTMSGGMRKWAVYDNTVPAGQPPRQVSRSW